jgi:hypothetical protein
MEGVCGVADADCMSGIGTACKTGDQIGFRCENIYDFAFTFITPLGTQNDTVASHYFIS